MLMPEQVLHAVLVLLWEDGPVSGFDDGMARQVQTHLRLGEDDRTDAEQHILSHRGDGSWGGRRDQVIERSLLRVEEAGRGGQLPSDGPLGQALQALVARARGGGDEDDGEVDMLLELTGSSAGGAALGGIPPADPLAAFMDDDEPSGGPADPLAGTPPPAAPPTEEAPPIQQPPVAATAVIPQEPTPVAAATPVEPPVAATSALPVARTTPGTPFEQIAAPSAPAAAAGGHDVALPTPLVGRDAPPPSDFLQKVQSGEIPEPEPVPEAGALEQRSPDADAAQVLARLDPGAIQTYRLMLETVWVDNVLDPKEVTLLARKRSELSIPFEAHLVMLRQMLEG